MTRRTKTTAATLAAAGALAFGAYGLGSQAGDGAANAASKTRSAANDARSEHGPGGRGLSTLAGDLGVTEAKLRVALDAVHSEEEQSGDRHTEMAADLASALGKSTDEVTKALEKVHTARETAFAAGLAKALGVDADKVKAALDKTEPENRHHASLRGLATELGVTTRKLRTALRTVREDRPDRAGRGRHGADQAALADALGVTQDQLDAAYAKLDDTMQKRHEQRRAELAKKLADKLGISADKVTQALADAPGPGFGGPGGGHHGGPRGGHHDGPGRGRR